MFFFLVGLRVGVGKGGVEGRGWRVEGDVYFDGSWGSFGWSVGDRGEAMVFWRDWVSRR